MSHRVWTSWSLQPIVLVGLATAAWAYGRGLTMLWRGDRRRGVGPLRVACFASGLFVLFVALVSPVHRLSGELLWVHMVQHVLLVLVAAPLLVLGAPLVPMTLALPPPWRRRVRAWGRTAWGRPMVRIITRPVTAWVLSVSALWAWHLPPLYDDAVRNEAIHSIEHATFLATALLFWWVAIRPGPGKRAPGGAEVLYVITAGLPSGALGAVLTFAASPLYAPYARTAVAWGLTPLQDQQLAGVIMWVPAGLVYMVAGGFLFVHWLKNIERQARLAEDRTGSVGLLGERS